MPSKHFQGSMICEAGWSGRDDDDDDDMLNVEWNVFVLFRGEGAAVLGWRRGVCCASCTNVSKIPNKVTVTLVKNLPF